MLGDLGVLCQVVTAIVSFVSSIIGIAISLQNETCFGISVRKFSGLRKEYHYSIKSIIVLSIILIVLDLVFYMLEMVIACIGIAIIAIVFCVFISCTEIPIMTKNEQALINVVKKHLKLKWKNPEEDSKELKDVVKYLITQEYNLQETYNLLKDKDDEYNKYLLLKLLDLQTDLAFELQKLEVSQLRHEIVDSLINNISDILNFNFDLTEILEDNLVEYKHLVTRVLFRTAELEEGQAKTTHLIGKQIIYLNYAKYDEKKKHFVMSTVLSMLTVSIASNKFDFIRSAKKEFSQNYHHLGENNAMSLIFALVSLQFFYLSSSARNVSDELKINIQSFIDEDIVVDRTKVTTWRNLYKTFVQKFSIDFDTLIKYFFVNEHNFDVPLYSNQAYFVVLDTEYVLNWYIANLFNSQNSHNFDYNKLVIEKLETTYYLKRISDKMFGQTREAKIPTDLVQFVKFFLPNVEEFKWFEMFENQTHNFRNFIDGLKIQQLEDKSKKAKSVNNKDLSETYKNKLSALIENEWGYDPSICLDKEPKRCLNLLTEKTSDAINYEECIIDFFSENIYYELKRNATVTTINRGENFDEQIKSLLKRKIVAISKNLSYSLTYYLKDQQLKSLYEKSYDKAKKIESKIFYDNTVFVDQAFLFNFSIMDFQVINLTQEQITEKVKEYQRADGQYIFDGAFLSREQIEKYISEQFVVLSLCARYKVINNADSIVQIELYPEICEDEENIEKE